MQTLCSAFDLPYFILLSHGSVRLVPVVSLCKLGSEGTERVRAGPGSHSRSVVELGLNSGPTPGLGSQLLNLTASLSRSWPSRF